MQMKTEVEPINISDLGTWFGKMYPELSAQTAAETSKPSLKKSSASSKKTSPICVQLCRGGGQNQDAYTTRWAVGQLLGAYTTHSFGESPSEENVSRLSQILEDSPLPKYSLSGRACAGILNRAERRGKELPKELKAALEQQAYPSKNEPENQGGARESSFSVNTQEPCQRSITRAFSIQGITIDRDAKQNGSGISSEIAHTLDGADRHGVMAFKQGNGAKAGSIGAAEELSPTLSAVESGTNRVPAVARVGG